MKGILLAGVLVGAAAASPPNVVFIMTDDQAHDAVGYKGRYPFLKTPNIDRIAAEGAVFENFFVSTAMCSPSRAAFLTGAYGHKNGVLYNEQSDPQITLFPEVLQQHGYQTALVGKWHMAHNDDPRPGFDYWLSFLGQGEYFDCPLNENGHRFLAKKYITDELTDHAERWLREGRDPKRPFVLFLWHKANHEPFDPAPRHVAAWPDTQLERPLSSTYDMADRPAWQRHAETYGVHNKVFHENREQPTPDRLPPGNWDGRNQTFLNHLRSILAVDESVGRMYEVLKDLDELDNTLLIFGSDNGFFLGEHRRNDKRLAYEESIRIPFAARFPARIPAGTRITASAVNIDLAPTIFDLADIPFLDQFQGRSLVPLFTGETPGNWREYFFYTYFQETYAPGIPTILAVRTGEWKYIHHPDLPDEIDELYDLRADPSEMKNLFTKPEYKPQLEKMRQLLKQAQADMGYDKPIPPQF